MPALGAVSSRALSLQLVLGGTTLAAPLLPAYAIIGSFFWFIFEKFVVLVDQIRLSFSQFLPLSMARSATRFSTLIRVGQILTKRNSDNAHVRIPHMYE